MENHKIGRANDPDTKLVSAANMPLERAKRKREALEKAEAEAKDRTEPYQLKKEDTDTQ